MPMSNNRVPFVKMNGAGNQIVVADMRGHETFVSPQAAITLSSDPATRFDQLMEVRDSDSEGVDAVVRILNSDGSEAEACGNGTRCVVSWLNRQSPREQFVFRTRAGILNARYVSETNITVDMGIPKFGWDEIPLEEEFGDTTGIELQVGPIDDPILHTPSVANMGNPHCVFWADRDVNGYNLEQIGALLVYHPMFPEGANISIAEVKSRDHVILRTYERGVGITQACGSAACATLVCAVRKGLTDRKALVTLPGGELEIEWNDRDHVLMTGPAEFEFSGMFDPETGVTTREDA